MKPEALAPMMVALQNRGCPNVNLVTPTHQVPQILAALPEAIERGLIVRHLVLPGGLAGTAAVARFLAEEISAATYLNLMDQYHPCHEAFAHPLLRRRITVAEFAYAVDAVRAAGLTRVEGVTA